MDYRNIYTNEDVKAKVSLEFLPQSKPLSEAQQSTLRGQITTFDNTKFTVCYSGERDCHLLVFVQVLSGGVVRAFVMRSFYDSRGDWYEFLDNKLQGQGKFGRDILGPGELIGKGNNPFVDTGKDVTVTQKGVRFGNQVFILSPRE